MIPGRLVTGKTLLQEIPGQDLFKWMLEIEQLDKRTLKVLFSREVLIIYVTTLRPVSYLLSGDESKVVFGISFSQSHRMVELQGNSGHHLAQLLYLTLQ